MILPFLYVPLLCNNFQGENLDSNKPKALCKKNQVIEIVVISIEPRREKTGLRDFRPGLTQTNLYSHRSRLEA